MLIKNAMVIPLITLFLVHHFSLPFTQDTSAATTNSMWQWPVDIPIYIREHAEAGTTIENVNFGVRNLDLTYSFPYRLSCLESGRHRQYHAGVDLYHPSGTMHGISVYAIADGGVIHAGGDYPGRAVVIEHKIPGEQRLYSVYMHLTNVPPSFQGASLQTPVVITKGAFIGSVLEQSYTGRFPNDLHQDGNLDDSHLHFEIQTFGIQHLYPNCPDPNDLAAGLGYTYPETPEELGYLDPIKFLADRIYPYRQYLSFVTSANVTSANVTSATVTETSSCIDGSNLLQKSNFDEGEAPYRPWFEISSAYGAAQDEGQLQYYPFVSTQHPERSGSTVWSEPQAAMFNVPLATRERVVQRDEELIQSFTTPSASNSLSIRFYYMIWGTFFGTDPDGVILMELTDARTGIPIQRTELAVPTDTGSWQQFNGSLIDVSPNRRYSVRISLIVDNDGEIIPARDTFMAIDNVEVLIRCHN